MLNENKPRLITFDVYSALLDVQDGLTHIFAEASGLLPDKAGPVVAAWRAKQLEWAAVSNSLSCGRTLFRDCTRQSLNYVCARNGLGLDADIKERLVFAWDKLPLLPEANDAVTDLAAKGYQIAILSNGDQDMLEAVGGLFSVGFHHILSSETAGYYKPHPSVYALPEKLLGIACRDTLHVAGGANDVVGAVAYGMPCIWSNKFCDVLIDPFYAPNYEIEDLSNLADLLT
jgi:2-haloacid dehalogenase